MKLTLLGLVGLVAAGPLDMEKRAHSHHHVEVQRYAVPGCIAGSKMGKIQEAEDGDCENFDSDEAGFLSFTAKISYNKKKKLGRTEECRLYAYAQKDCKGQMQPMDDISDYEGQCQSQNKIFGRSIMLKCMEKAKISVASDFAHTAPKTGGIPGAASTVSPKGESTVVQFVQSVVATNPQVQTVTAPLITRTVFAPGPGSTLTVAQSPLIVNPAPFTLTITPPGASLTVVPLTVPVPNTPAVDTPKPSPTTQKFMTITTTMAVSDYIALQAMAMATATATVHV